MKHLFTSFVFFIAFVGTFAVASVMTVLAFGDDNWQLRALLEVAISLLVAYFSARSIFRSYDAATARNAKDAAEAKAQRKLEAEQKAARKAARKAAA